MNKPMLCVGGPLDGKYISVREPVPDNIIVPDPTAYTYVDKESKMELLSEPILLHNYRLITMNWGEGSDTKLNKVYRHTGKI